MNRAILTHALALKRPFPIGPSRIQYVRVKLFAAAMATGATHDL
jgi:hypothetical protein